MSNIDKKKKALNKNTKNNRNNKTGPSSGETPPSGPRTRNGATGLISDSPSTSKLSTRNLTSTPIDVKKLRTQDPPLPQRIIKTQHRLNKSKKIITEEASKSERDSSSESTPIGSRCPSCTDLSIITDTSLPTFEDTGETNSDISDSEDSSEADNITAHRQEQLKANIMERAEESPQRGLDSQEIVTTGKLIEEIVKKCLEPFRQEFRLHNEKTDQLMETLSAKVNHLENKIKETMDAQKELRDEHDYLNSEISYLKVKIADMEDRDRRNNLKFRGIPEKITQDNLGKYATKMFQTILPQASQQELLIERIHRLPKPKYLSDDIPRDVIAKLHYFPTKDAIIQKISKIQKPPHPYGNIKIFNDFSAATLQKRKNFKPVTDHLRSKGVLYRWGFPTRILVRKDSFTHALIHLENANGFLDQLGIPRMDEKLLKSNTLPNRKLQNRDKDK